MVSDTTVALDLGRENEMRHCPNCGGEVIVWDADLQADKCLDCGESWTIEEQEAAQEAAQEKLEHDWDI